MARRRGGFDGVRNPLPAARNCASLPNWWPSVTSAPAAWFSIPFSIAPDTSSSAMLANVARMPWHLHRRARLLIAPGQRLANVADQEQRLVGLALRRVLLCDLESLPHKQKLVV
jgi:hypothetical protein